MRLPRLRVPLPRLSLEWLRQLGGRSTLLYAGYTAFLFLVFLVVTFPHELVIRRALSGLGHAQIGLDFNSASFAWLKGYELSGMRIGSASDGQAPYVECTHMWVRPALGALVRGNPYDLLLRADLYGGVAQGEVIASDGKLAGQLQWNDLNLGRYRTLTALLDEGQLSGRVSGTLSFENRSGAPEAAQSSGEIVLDAAALTGAKIGGFGVPDVKFRQAKLKFVIHAGRVEIQEFQANGDVNIQGSGHVILRDPPQESVLNLRVTIEQSLATPDPVKTLVGLIPRAPGAKPDAPINIMGTLAKPRVR